MISPMTNYSIRILTARSFIKTHQKRAQLALYYLQSQSASSSSKPSYFYFLLLGRRRLCFTIPFSASMVLCSQDVTSCCLASAEGSGGEGTCSSVSEISIIGLLYREWPTQYTLQRRTGKRSKCHNIDVSNRKYQLKKK